MLRRQHKLDATALNLPPAEIMSLYQPYPAQICWIAIFLYHFHQMYSQYAQQSQAALSEVLQQSLQHS